MTLIDNILTAKKNKSLVLSGGGTKAAAFHVGVAFALRDHGLDPYRFNSIIGSSAGSLVASLIASGYSLENISNCFMGKGSELAHDGQRAIPKLKYTKVFKVRPEIAKEQAFSFFKIRNLKWLKMTGFFSAQGLERFLREEVLPMNRFQDLGPDLFVVATQLNTSKKVVFSKTVLPPPAHDPRVEYQTHVKISEAVAASAALPILFAPFPILDESGESHLYIDGEIRETLSTHIAVDAGADFVVSSYTHQPYRYTSEVGSLLSLGLPGIVIQSIYTLIEQKINSVHESYRSKQNAINAVLDFGREKRMDPETLETLVLLLEKELHQKRDILMIQIHPDPEDSKMFLSEHFSLNSKKLLEIAKAGFRAANKELAKYKI